MLQKISVSLKLELFDQESCLWACLTTKNIVKYQSKRTFFRDSKVGLGSFLKVQCVF